MPQADMFKCNVCGQTIDITNQENKITGPDGKTRTINRAHGYHEIRVLDYGARTTVTIKACGECKGAVLKGSNTRVLGGSKTSTWAE